MFNHISAWKLIRRQGKGPYFVRFTKTDGKIGERKTSATTRGKAEREAFELLRLADESIEAALHQENRELNGWQEFCRRYVAEKLEFGPYKTRQAFETARNRLDDLVPGIEWVSDLDERVFSLFALRLREEGKSVATIHAYRNHLMSSLKWARQVRIIDRRPDPPPIGRAENPARGRPITREEAERIAAQLPSIVGEEFAERWAWNLEALWRSGFRLGETFAFTWEAKDHCHSVLDLDSARPMIQISARAEKARQNRIIPMAPDFAELLRAVPKMKRRDQVFRWTLSTGDSRSIKTVGKYISLAGRAARVVVSEKNGKTKFASAHDFRRAFGARWSPRVMPDTLRVLMRHASIKTTLEYYVQENAKNHAEALYAAIDERAEPSPILSARG